MTHLAPSAIATTAAVDGRLPMGQSVLIIVTLSLGLWTGIGLLVRWAIG